MSPSSFHRWRRWLLAWAALNFVSCANAIEVPPSALRDDLVLSGKFQGFSPTERITLTRAELLAVPGLVELDEKPARPIAAAKLKVLPLDQLLKKVPLAREADALVLICADRWESYLSIELIRKHRPYLLLLYAGRTPAEGWPTFGSIEGLAPYFCGVSPQLGPPVEGVPEFGAFDATQVIEIRAVTTKERYAPFFRAGLDHLSPLAQAGRATFLQQCNTCHQGPGGVGGNVSQRPLMVLQVHATMNADYFRKFVRNPKQFMPQTIMPKHENFSDETLAGLIAFLSETSAAGIK